MATYRTITGFKAALSGGGARPNLFEVSIPNFPVGGWDDIEFNFMCKAALNPVIVLYVAIFESSFCN